MERPKISVGYHTGMLKVVEPTANRKNGYTIWRCRCDCSGERCLDTRTLQRGTIQDCGCVTRVLPGITDLQACDLENWLWLPPQTADFIPVL